MLNEDYKDILQNLLEEKVKFLVVGAYAMAIYKKPRATGDIDIWVEASKTNSEKILKALVRFGAPIKDLDKHTFAEKGIVFQIGVAPRRIDLITYIDGVEFDSAYKSKKIVDIEGLKVPFISKKDLIKNKKSTSRIKDMADAEELEKQ